MYQDRQNNWEDYAPRKSGSSFPQTSEHRRRVAQVKQLLTVRRGATVQELIALTRSNACDIHRAIRQLLEDGYEVFVDNDPDGNRTYHLFYR